MLVEALRDEEITPARLTRLPPGLEPFVRDLLDEIEQHSSRTPSIRALLGLCAVALGPLTAEDLEQLDPTSFRFRGTLNQATKAVARFVIGDGSAARGYVFGHPRLREIFLEQVLSARQRDELRQHFVAYGRACYEQGVAPPAYLRQF